MALPGLLVEYLVVGSMALLWALPLAGIDFSGTIPFGSAAALAPAIYVLGMFVDFIAFMLLTQLPRRKYSLKHAVRIITHNGLDEGLKEDNPFSIHNHQNSQGFIWLGLREPGLLKEVKERSSRDRIARGAFINTLFLWVVSY